MSGVRHPPLLYTLEPTEVLRGGMVQPEPERGIETWRIPPHRRLVLWLMTGADETCGNSARRLDQPADSNPGKSRIWGRADRVMLKSGHTRRKAAMTHPSPYEKPSRRDRRQKRTWKRQKPKR